MRRKSLAEPVIIVDSEISDVRLFASSKFTKGNSIETTKGHLESICLFALIRKAVVYASSYPEYSEK